ncbi:MAG TPA: hypothetical protein VMZ71_05705 [Gemmataceae bacterium]|nr:hypothetical protein [Gemmataceae bacterium]
MSALTIQNFPPELLAQLRDRAALSGRTVEEELISATGRGLRTPTDVPPEPLHLIPSPEIPAPFDLIPPGPIEKVAVRDGGPLRLEFWYDEDKRVG